MTTLIERLKGIVGSQGWAAEPEDLEPFLTEWRGTWHGATPLMVMPASTDEVSAIVTACAECKVGVVPQGGNTGLCGGAIPDPDGTQILLSLRRLNRIRALEPEDYSVVVEAGCTLANLQAAAAASGRLFPLSLAAEGTCQVGGNLSTNAGGVNVLRYGTARDQVLGLEVVLADGRVLNGLRTLRKDTAGYDLKHLFVGSEGTLGIITAASLKLYPPVPRVATAWFAVDSAARAVSLLAALREDLGDRLLAFELISEAALQLVLRHIGNTSAPLHASSPWYVLLEVSLDGNDVTVETALENALERSLATDAVLAKNNAERDALWRIRHSISAAQKLEGASLKHDVSVPVAAIDRFIETATSAVTAACPSARVIAFGHAGDGNVHFNVSQPPGAEAERFLGERERVARIVYDIVRQFDGSFSAEHGVGVLRKDELQDYRGGVEIDLMRRLKYALDPDNLMNPGKIL